MNDKLCSIENCNRQAQCKGMCNKHYMRKDPNKIDRRRHPLNTPFEVGKLYGGLKILKLFSCDESTSRNQLIEVECVKCGHIYTLKRSALYTRNCKGIESCVRCRNFIPQKSVDGQVYGTWRFIKRFFIDDENGIRKYKAEVECIKCGYKREGDFYTVFKNTGARECSNCIKIHPGEKYGMLTTIEVNKNKKETKSGEDFWLCKCDCGGITSVSEYHLRAEKTISCGCLCGRPKTNRPEMLVPYWYFNRLKRCALKSKYEVRHDFTITHEYLNQLLIQQNNKCAITGEELIFLHHESNGSCNVSSLSTGSVDRIDNTKGYIPGNVHWVCKDINFFRGNFSLNRFMELCNKIVEYNSKSSNTKYDILKAN